jgi:hypothetical protein
VSAVAFQNALVELAVILMIASGIAAPAVVLWHMFQSFLCTGDE